MTNDFQDAIQNGMNACRPLYALEKAGCPVNRSFFQVHNCSQAVMGGFRPDEGVVLCHNNLLTRTDMENMLTHELVHAYDHCRCVAAPRRPPRARGPCSSTRASRCSSHVSL